MSHAAVSATEASSATSFGGNMYSYLAIVNRIVISKSDVIQKILGLNILNTVKNHESKLILNFLTFAENPCWLTVMRTLYKCISVTAVCVVMYITTTVIVTHNIRDIRGRFIP